MFISNLKKQVIGIDGVINLKPGEANRYVDESNKDLAQRCKVLASAGYISISKEVGMEKNGLPATKVSTPEPEKPKVEEEQPKTKASAKKTPAKTSTDTAK